jgi:NAD(P)-dependent dehydrogenase (short-subunit alcohol dehydrogenase family)
MVLCYSRVKQVHLKYGGRMLLNGKNALIIGGSRGIGRAVAEEFLKEGARLIIASRSEKELSKVRDELLAGGALRHKVIIDTADVRDTNSLLKVDYLIKLHWDGRLDILVNAAGIQGDIGLFAKSDTERWRWAIETNLIGAANAMRAFLPGMIARGFGKIINFSGGGAASPRPYFSAYAASKAAVVRLTETVAEEMRELGAAIDINAIAPGAVNTRLLDEIISAGPEKAGRKEYELALKRKSEGGEDPKKAAALAVFLASRLSDGLTGRLISAVWDKWQDIPLHLKEIMDSDIYTLRRVKPKERGYDW